MSQLVVQVKDKVFACRCGSYEWLFRELDSWNTDPIEKATYLHVRCLSCDACHALLGKPDDWTLSYR